MSCPVRPRLPLAPVAAMLDAHAAHIDHAGHPGSAPGRPCALADLLGVSRRHAQRISNEGAIAERHADTLAAALGYHPLNLWPEWAEL